MCKKIRVLYSQCGHTVTESMEYCMPWADRQAILDKEGAVWKCPNSSVELETDDNIVCGLCDENYPHHLKARRNNYTLGMTTPTGGGELPSSKPANFKCISELRLTSWSFRGVFRAQT